jgi:hypothetical protein
MRQEDNQQKNKNKRLFVPKPRKLERQKVYA